MALNRSDRKPLPGVDPRFAQAAAQATPQPLTPNGGYGGYGGGASMPSSIAALDSTVPAPQYARGTPSGGSAGVTQGGYDRQQEIQLQHDLEMQRMQSKKDMFTSLMGQYGGSGGGARVTRTPEDTAKEEAGRSAAFARAKETAGQNARASMASLNDVVAERGLMGSSVEAAQQGAIVGGAGSQVNDFLRDQAISEADRASEISDQEYQGQITQRGQEMARKQAILNLLAGGLY